MKQTENDEMDLLLRSLARREGSRSVAPEDHPAMHLDADELSSYAEQALPAAARARYTSHLAECSSCRKIVSELTSASGANVREHSVSQKTSVSLLHKLGALFSPDLLRYAVPALALFVFIAVGLVALREQPQPDFVAQNQPAASRDATIETKQTDSPAAPGDSAAAIEERQSSESRTSTGKGGGDQAKTAERNETSNNARPTDSVSVTSDRDASAGKAAGVASPSYAPEPVAASPPKPQTTHTESRTEVAARQKGEADKEKDESAREQEGARARTDDSQNQVARPQSRTGALIGQSQERLRKLEAKPASGAGAKTNDDTADTRTVSGRRFRQQGGVWIDTAYQSSTATTTLVRGSEQFRALVADEPGIRAIAAQLPGEVVVVWKGRAYRIR
ncbi:MAG: hypothetical protein H0V18_02690 [Pyrinomonadaceae bacterium]|nr:hypothetical protein [Pyrinomonadaceae bacterium]